MFDVTYIICAGDINKEMLLINYPSTLVSEGSLRFYNELVDNEEIAVLEIKDRTRATIIRHPGAPTQTPRKLLDKLAENAEKVIGSRFLIDLKHNKLIYNLTTKEPEGVFLEVPIELMYRKEWMLNRDRFLLVLTSSNRIGKLANDDYYNLVGLTITSIYLPYFYGVGDQLFEYHGVHIIFDLLMYSFNCFHTLPSSFTTVVNSPCRKIPDEFMPQNPELIKKFESYIIEKTKADNNLNDPKKSNSYPAERRENIPDGVYYLSSLFDGSQVIPKTSFPTNVVKDISPQQLVGRFKIFSTLGSVSINQGKLYLYFWKCNGENKQFILNQLMTNTFLTDDEVVVFLNGGYD